MIESLLRVYPEAKVYVFAHDNQTIRTLHNHFNSRFLTTIPISNIENEKLRKVKSERSRGEYSWTVTPFIIKYCLTDLNLPDCTYLDADLFFFNSPEIIFQQIGDADCLITPHYFALPYKILERNGKYCVQFIPFRNTETSLRILKKWSQQCVEWCYARRENNKFGDQKYLETWVKDYGKFVAVLSDPDLCLAPWNILSYTTDVINGSVEVKALHSSNWKRPVFYHFHGFRLNPLKYASFPFFISRTCQKVIYEPYIRLLQTTSSTTLA